MKAARKISAAPAAGKKQKTDTEADGRALAIEMIEHFDDRDLDADDCALDQIIEGKPQHNIVLGYLERLRVANSRDMDKGFAAVLTDFLSQKVKAGATSLYQRLDRDIRAAEKGARHG